MIDHDNLEEFRDPQTIDLQDEGYFLFETRNPTPRHLFELRRPGGEKFTLPNGSQLVITAQQHYDPLTPTSPEIIIVCQKTL